MAISINPPAVGDSSALDRLNAVGTIVV